MATPSSGSSFFSIKNPERCERGACVRLCNSGWEAACACACVCVHACARVCMRVNLGPG